MKRVLTIVAHTDDEVIGVGGTLRKHVRRGDDVYVLILGDGKTSRTATTRIQKEQINLSRKETKKALSIIGVRNYVRLDLPDNRFDSIPLLEIVKKVSKIVTKIHPHTVFTHHHGDLNIDHRKTFEATITACRPIETFVEKILLFETLSSTEMAGPGVKEAFLPNYFINIHRELDKKLAAMAAYESELKTFPHPRSLETIRNNALVWGSKVNTTAAEAFTLFRYIEK